jgi:hypothetical protein
MLTGEMSRPANATEYDTPHPRRLIDDVDHVGELPV